MPSTVATRTNSGVIRPQPRAQFGAVTLRACVTPSAIFYQLLSGLVLAAIRIPTLLCINMRAMATACNRSRLLHRKIHLTNDVSLRPMKFVQPITVSHYRSSNVTSVCLCSGPQNEIMKEVIIRIALVCACFVGSQASSVNASFPQYAELLLKAKADYKVVYDSSYYEEPLKYAI